MKISGYHHALATLDPGKNLGVIQNWSGSLGEKKNTLLLLEKYYVLIYADLFDTAIVENNFYSQLQILNWPSYQKTTKCNMIGPKRRVNIP
jgi:hypothetical protein